MRVGSLVSVQRHRYVEGDPNWDPRMARYLGRTTRVTRLSGVDDRGCPGVRVEADGGRWFWRVRDLVIEPGSSRAEPPAPTGWRPAAELPQRCGRTDATAEFGPLAPGAVVVLGRHRHVRGDDNWATGMAAYVGRTARVVALAGTDERGCPVVQVDADGRQWFWRVRDLVPTERSGGELAYRASLASDHGRPGAGELAAAAPDPAVPQECGLSDEAADYGPIEVGREVRLSRHRPVGGQANWVEDMEAYVGDRARVTEHVGVDEQGCPLVRVDVDGGEWFWRLRDLGLPPPEESGRDED